MRQLSQGIKDYSVTLGSSSLAQSAKQIPNYGSVQGLDFELLVSLAGATASVTSTVTIDNVIDSISIETVKGKTIANLVGTDLTVINDVLSPIGHRVTPPGVTTDSNGNVNGLKYRLFLPISISQADMPAVVKVTFAPASALESSTLTSAGTVTVVWNLRASYSTAKLDTLFVKASNPPVGDGENALSPYLPQGFEVRALCVNLPGGDDIDLGYITLLQDGAALLSREPNWSFANDDDALMVSGHLSGEFIVRVPVFTVNSTTVLDADLTASGLPLRLYSFAIRAQKNTNGN
jgi:hypothetical protein